MKIDRLGDALMVRIPDALARDLALAPGQDVEITALSDQSFKVERTPNPPSLKDRERALSALQAIRPFVPVDFRFNRAEAHDRTVY